MAMFEFRLPDIGEGVVQGEIVKWHVQAGAHVREDQLLVEVLTDKATVEITSPRTGSIAELRAKEGAMVKVGSVFLVIDESGSGGSTPPPVPAAPAPVSPSPVAGPAPPTPAGASAGDRENRAAPAVRKFARVSNIDLAQVDGSAPGGRITREDVEKAIAARSAPLPRVATPDPARAVPPAPSVPPATASTGGGPREEMIPVRGIRKRIAENMVRSRHTAAHFTIVEEVDVTDLVARRAKTNEKLADRGIKLTYLPFIIKAVVAGLRQYPYLNATVDDANETIIVKRYYNIGVATATEGGLIVPVIKDADRKSMLQIAKELDDQAGRTRAGKVALADLQGGTFTITSLGPKGGLHATPIINHPEVAILGVHKIAKRAMVVGDAIVPREMMNLSLSLDHRIIDGHVGAEFLSLVKGYLEHPDLLFMELV